MDLVGLEALKLVNGRHPSNEGKHCCLSVLMYIIGGGQGFKNDSMNLEVAVRIQQLVHPCHHYLIEIEGPSTPPPTANFSAFDPCCQIC